MVAFEPDLFNAWLLGRNLLLNGIDNAVVSVSAVGREPGTARLNRCKGSNLGRRSVLTDYALVPHQCGRAETGKVGCHIAASLRASDPIALHKDPD